MSFEIPRMGPKDWPNGNYTSRCLKCESSFIGPKLAHYCNECNHPVAEPKKIDFEAIRESKTQMIERFLAAKAVAEEFGYIVIKKI